MERVAALTRAYVGTLYGDARHPTVEVTADEGLVLDWTDEAVAVRIVQCAVENVWRHAQAGAIAVALTVEGDALAVEVRDDGVGFAEDTLVPGGGLTAMRTLAELAGGYLCVDSAPGAGTRIRAVLGAPPPSASPPRRPHLRLVTPT